MTSRYTAAAFCAVFSTFHLPWVTAALLPVQVLLGAGVAGTVTWKGSSYSRPFSTLTASRFRHTGCIRAASSSSPRTTDPPAHPQDASRTQHSEGSFM